MQSTIGIDIQAPPRLVFDLARDVERWPALLPHYLRVHVRERHPDGSRTADMVAVRTIIPVVGLGIPVAWRARTWSDGPARRLRFQHVAGATRGMDVTWRIEPRAGGCRVSIEHAFRPRFAPWAVIVDRLFVRPIAGRTLATFRSIAEAVAATERSEPASPPNTST